MDIQNAIKLSRTVRDCSFDPEQWYDQEFEQDGTPRMALRSSSKQMWFYTYCKEKSLQGQIYTSEPVLQIFGNGTAMVIVTATVYIDGKVESTASAAQGFEVNDTRAMDVVVQTASTFAIGRALANAGFGIIGGYLLPGNEAPQNPVAAQPVINPVASPVVNRGNPAVVQPAPAPQGQQHTVTAAVPQQMSLMNDTVTSPVPAQPTDKLAWAKTVVWQGRGSASGKTLGELLATQPKQICWIAETWNGTGEIKEAALLLLPEAQRLTGR